ncbi:hypothetical protein D3C72_1661230 [compost metagenome]
MPFSIFASITIPVPERFGLAFNSATSASSFTCSSNSLIPVFLRAETSTKIVLPPHSSGTISISVNCCLIFSGFAPGLSILFTATMIGTPAAFAWLTASCVCGIIPSSAATTMIAMSVAFAPRARIAVKASWPGVSRNVIRLPSSILTE